MNPTMKKFLKIFFPWIYRRYLFTKREISLQKIRVIENDRKLEKRYRKDLLLDKLKPFMGDSQKQKIFDAGYCWDILLNDKNVASLCYEHVLHFQRKKIIKLEKYILKDLNIAVRYCAVLKKERWEELEEALIAQKNYIDICLYAESVICGRWPEVEDLLMRDPFFAFRYISYIIKGRWYEYEIYMTKNNLSRTMREYKEMVAAYE